MAGGRRSDAKWTVKAVMPSKDSGEKRTLFGEVKLGRN